MGFPENAFTGAVTSGGECAKGLQEVGEGGLGLFVDEIWN